MDKGMCRVAKDFFKQHSNCFYVLFTSDGLQIVFVGNTNVIFLFDVASGKQVRTFSGHTGYIWSLAVTSDAQYLVSASVDNTARVWRLDNGAKVYTLRHLSNVYFVTLSPDNKYVLTGTGYPCNAVHVWSMVDGNLLYTIEGHTHIVSSVAVSPDGLHVVSGSNDKTARVWLLADKTLQRAIKHPCSVFSVAVTPDSQRIVTGCGDGVVRLFLLATGELVRELRGHAKCVWRVAVSASGRHVVSGSYDKTVRVWSLINPSFKPLVLINQTTKDVFGVAFHPNCKQVASASHGSVRLWTVCEWTDRDHQLFGQKFKALVFFLMCVKAKLDVLFEEDNQSFFLPRLPMAVWLQVFAFLSEQDN